MPKGRYLGMTTRLKLARRKYHRRKFTAVPKPQNKSYYDLGIKQLLPEWRNFLNPKDLKEDIFAGLTVACIAIPLSLAIALASGVEPAIGLITAIIAGIVCALFGGTKLAVSGPAAAMSILIAATIEKHGLSGLMLVGLICGVLQLATGYFGMGRFARFVPLPVIAGFTAGIGAIILIGQLPRALGLPPPDQNHVFDVITHLGEYIHAMSPMVFVIALLSIAIMKGLPKIFPRLPAALLAVIIPSIVVAGFGLTDVPVVGSIPDSLPLPSFPSFSDFNFNLISELFMSALLVYFLASLETLLSSSAVDKMAKGHRHDPNQELIGQGLGNIAVTFFGGIPVTGVIARSSVNVQAGAKTRRSAIIHSLVLIAAVYLFSHLLAQIPVAALAGVLIACALRMMSFQEFKSLFHGSRSDALVYATTFFVIVFVDLVIGVQAGVAAALLFALFQMSHTRILLHQPASALPYRISLHGSLTFLSSSKIEKLNAQLADAKNGQSIVVDASSLTSMDTTGACMLIEFMEGLHQRNMPVILKGMSKNFDRLIKSNEAYRENLFVTAITEADVTAGLSSIDIDTVRSRLIHGAIRYQLDSGADERGLLQRLAQGQDPHTLFITCSDSRIDPNQITSTDPGEMFVIRNVGNLVPGCDLKVGCSEAAAIEFALDQLNIKNIIVCGHSNCGAIKACMAEDSVDTTSGLGLWLERMQTSLRRIAHSVTHDEAAQANVLTQIVNLRSYPSVQRKLSSGELSIQGWFFDMNARIVFEWDPEVERFMPIQVSCKQKLLLATKEMAVNSGALVKQVTVDHRFESI